MAASEGSSERTYRLFWAIGTALSFALYYSGIVALYTFIRRHILHKRRVVALMYHRVGDTQGDGLTVSVATFNRQLDYLRRGFAIRAVDDAVATGLDGRPLTDDVVTLTFDDGYRDNFDNAWPLLQRHALPATIFLIADRIDRDEAFLSTKQIRAMARHNIAFGCHTLSHPILSTLSPAAAAKEIVQAKETLERLVGAPMHYFAYPKGKREHFTAATEELVRKAGFLAAFATENGAIDPSSDRFALPRLGVRDTPLFVFKTRLSGIFESKPIMAIRRLMGVT